MAWCTHWSKSYQSCIFCSDVSLYLEHLTLFITSMKGHVSIFKKMILKPLKWVSLFQIFSLINLKEFWWFVDLAFGSYKILHSLIIDGGLRHAKDSSPHNLYLVIWKDSYSCLISLLFCWYEELFYVQFLTFHEIDVFYFSIM